MKLTKFFIPAALLTATVAFSQEGNRGHKTVWDGVYTNEQADRGREEYLTICSPCHGTKLEGLNGIRLSGPEFMERWREFDIGGLYYFISQSMPRRREGSPNRPGSLSEKQYTDIISHILRTNSFPAGGQELTAEGMKSIQIEGKDGPRPLPNGALAQMVGCLAPGRSAGWRLVQASEPARTSISKNSTEAELKLAMDKPTGRLEFRLSNLEILAGKFEPKDHVGKKIQTKGYLIRQPGNERIDITSMEVAGEHCGQ